MNLNTTNWKEFSLDRLFIIKKGKRLTSEDQEDGVYNYIGAIDSNNGIANHIAQQPIHKGNTISLSYNGSVGEAFYQKDPYWATDDVNALYSRYDGFNEPIGLFIATVIRAEKYKFSYGRKWTLENMQKSRIKLPVRRSSDGKPFIDNIHTYSDEGNVPDWKFMEQYVRRLHHKPLTTKNRHAKVAELNTTQWKEFVLNRVFTLKGGFYNKKPEHSQEGKIPFLGATESNNGVTEYYDLEDIKQWNKTGEEDFVLDQKIYNGNCIVIVVDGSVGNAFYQADEFTCSHSVTACYLKGHALNPMVGVFICTIIMQDKYRWSYGRKPHDLTKLGKSIIKLPIKHNSDGSPVIDKAHQYSDKGYIPDWQFMEDYIKSLPYGDRL